MRFRYYGGMKRAPKSWGFNTKDSDPSVRPQDDFFRYAGGGWLKKNPIPKEESRWGSFVMLRKQVDVQLQTIVKNLSRAERLTPGTPEQMIRDFYKSGMDEKGRERRGLSPIKHLLDAIEKLSSHADLLRLLAKLERTGIGGLWGLMLEQDYKNSDRYLLFLYQSGLGMPDRDYYLKDDAESVRVRTAYVQHLEKLHRIMGDDTKTAARSAALILAIETELAKVSMTKEDCRDVDKTYHKMPLGKLRALTPSIDWTTYFKILGAPVREVVVMQPDFLKAAARILQAHSIEDWRIYLRAHLVGAMSPYLTRALVREAFNFYGTTLMGAKHMKPLWRRVLGSVGASLGEPLGRIYVREYFPPEAKRKIVRVVDDLFLAYEARIKHLDWMSPATKKRALKKLHDMTRKLGYPDKWRSYAGLVIAPDDFAGNALRSAEYEHKRMLRKLAKPVDRKEWLMTPQTVNAYCNFGLNEIVFPAAILQPPFFNIEADDAVNYGAIGSVIGHEITHGFDDQGCKFDGKGNRKTWWTPKDEKSFSARAKVLKLQFDQYEVADGVPVNGQLTLGENIADLGGISIAYDAYQLHLARTGRAEIEGLSPEQRYFLGASLFEREHSRPEFEKTLALTDPHSPARFRVNGPMSNLPEFYAAFAVKKGDKLYREPKNRAKIW